MKLIEEQQRVAKYFRSFKTAQEDSTPLVLAQEMVSKIPEEVIKNKDSKFLDPCAGTGTFLVALFDRLSEYHGAGHIMSNMLYGFDNTLTSKTLLVKLGFKNIERVDFLNTELDMKFDVVIGNPPFNDDTTIQGDQRRKTKAIYLDFIKKAVRDSTSHVLIIAPSRGWIVGTHRDKNMREFTPHGLKSIYNVDSHFKIKIKDVCYYWFDKSYNETTLLHDETEPKHPILAHNLSKYFDTATSEKRGVLESLQTDTGHTVHLTTSVMVKIEDSSLINDDVNYKKWRVIFNMNGSKNSIGKVKIAKPGEYTSYSVSSLSFNTEEEALKVLEYLESDLVKTIMSESKISATNTKYHFSFIPDILS